MTKTFHRAPVQDDRLESPRRGRRRTSLLVSVRDRDEFDVVRSSGVDIIDWKEPSAGALGPVSATHWRSAAAACVEWDASLSGRPLLSAALGEPEQAMGVVDELPGEFAFAKVGLSGWDAAAKVRDVWQSIRARLSPQTELVAVAYADFARAGSLDPESVFQAAAEAGLRYALIDTFAKEGHTTLDHLGCDGLLRLQRVAERSGLWWALAGSIRIDSWTPLLAAGVAPDCVGVRGDVCERDREGRLDPGRVTKWIETLAGG